MFLRIRRPRGGEEWLTRYPLKRLVAWTICSGLCGQLLSCTELLDIKSASLVCIHSLLLPRNYRLAK